jgi:hypothetical protein
MDTLLDEADPSASISLRWVRPGSSGALKEVTSALSGLSVNRGLIRPWRESAILRQAFREGRQRGHDPARGETEMTFSFAGGALSG